MKCIKVSSFDSKYQSAFEMYFISVTGSQSFIHNSKIQTYLKTKYFHKVIPKFIWLQKLSQTT